MVRPGGPTDIRGRLELIADPTERAGARALECKLATADIERGSSVEVDGLTLVFDRPPAFIRNKRGEVIGLDAWVRVFEGGAELEVDPHRRISNPPTCVPDGTVHDEVDELGRAYQVSNFREAPREAWLVVLAQSIRGVPNAGGSGTVTTVFATAPGGEGDVDSSDATYATARTSGSLVATANHTVGQEVFASTFYCREAFVIFDTSGIPDTDTVSGVVLSLDGTTNASTTDFTSTAAASSYNGGVTVTGDWVDGSTLSGLTSLATFGSAGYDAAYNAFTSAGAAFNSAINKTGNTSLIVFSSRHSAGTEPPNSEYISYTDADAAGTTEDPKLDITHAGAAALLSLPVNINQAVNRASTY